MSVSRPLQWPMFWGVIAARPAKHLVFCSLLALLGRACTSCCRACASLISHHRPAAAPWHACLLLRGPPVGSGRELAGAACTGLQQLDGAACACKGHTSDAAHEGASGAGIQSGEARQWYRCSGHCKCNAMHSRGLQRSSHNGMANGNSFACGAAVTVRTAAVVVQPLPGSQWWALVYELFAAVIQKPC